MDLRVLSIYGRSKERPFLTISVAANRESGNPKGGALKHSRDTEHSQASAPRRTAPHRGFIRQNAHGGLRESAFKDDKSYPCA